MLNVICSTLLIQCAISIVAYHFIYKNKNKKPNNNKQKNTFVLYSIKER